MFGDALEWLGDTLDKPGRAVRGVLGGRPEEAAAILPFSDSLGITDKANAVSGAELSRQWTGLAPDSTEGQVTGFGLEMLLDPTNLVGLGLAGKAARGASVAARTAEEAVQGATKANALREAMLAKGAMPREVAELTVARDAAGNPIRQYHGTRSAFDDIDLTKAGSNDGKTLGPGYYTSPQAGVANDYAGIHPEYADMLAETAARAMKGFKTPEELSLHLDTVQSRAAGLQQARNEMLPDIRRLKEEMRSNPAKEAEHAAATDRFYSMGDEIQRLYKESAPLQDGMNAMTQLTAWGDKPRNVRMHYLDIRNPLDLRATDYGEQNLHPILADLNRQMEAGKLRTAADYKNALGSYGYDSVIAPHSGAALDQVQYVVFDPKQVYKPWLAPPQTPVPAGYGGPSPLRAAAAPLGALGAEQMLVNRAPDRNEQYLLSLLGR